MPPKNAVTGTLHWFNKCPRILVVVVLPWVPATARQVVCFVISPKTAERFKTLKLLFLK
jgi:hypothetical protein